MSKRVFLYLLHSFQRLSSLQLNLTILERIHLCLKTHDCHPRIAKLKITRDLALKHRVSHDGLDRIAVRIPISVSAFQGQ